MITELNSTLELDNPSAKVLVNPFSRDQVSFLTQDMSLDGQLKDFLKKGFGYWHTIIQNEFVGQNKETFVPTYPMMTKFWSHPSVMASFPNLSVIASHVSFIHSEF